MEQRGPQGGGRLGFPFPASLQAVSTAAVGLKNEIKVDYFRTGRVVFLCLRLDVDR